MFKPAEPGLFGDLPSKAETGRVPESGSHPTLSDLRGETRPPTPGPTARTPSKFSAAVDADIIRRAAENKAALEAAEKGRVQSFRLVEKLRAAGTLQAEVESIIADAEAAGNHVLVRIYRRELEANSVGRALAAALLGKHNSEEPHAD